MTRVTAIVHDADFYESELQNTDLYLVLARMHDSVIADEDLAETRAELKFLIEKLIQRRKKKK